MDNEMNLEICAARLKALRNDKKWTQEKVAEEITIRLYGPAYVSDPQYDINGNKEGFNVKTYRDYEKAVRFPNVNALLALSDIYGVSIDYLLGCSDCTAVDNEYIRLKTGLNDKAIETLTLWLKGQNKGLPFNSIDTINTLFSFPAHFAGILRCIQDYFHMDYRYPVYHTGQIEVVDSENNGQLSEVPQAVVPCTDIDAYKTKGGLTPLLPLAKDWARPWDNYMIPLGDNFFKGYSLYNLQGMLAELDKDMKKKQK